MISCSGLTVVNSDTAGVTGVTDDTALVTCNSGYVDSVSGASSFTATCSASSSVGGVSEWTGVNTCDGMLFFALSE